MTEADQPIVAVTELVLGEAEEVVMHVARTELEVGAREGRLGSRGITDHEILSAAVHDDGVEAQETPVSRRRDRSFDDRTIGRREVFLAHLQRRRDRGAIDLEVDAGGDAGIVAAAAPAADDERQEDEVSAHGHEWVARRAPPAQLRV